jgi:hypothetical protein
MTDFLSCLFECSDKSDKFGKRAAVRHLSGTLQMNFDENVNVDVS